MSDVFISYARSTADHAMAVADALRTKGYNVWRDDQIPPHRPYADVIAERLHTASAVLVLWSEEAVRSEWVRSEAERARETRKLVQLNLDGARLPMPFDTIECADLQGWGGNPDSATWRKILASIAEVANGLTTDSRPAASAAAPVAPAPRNLSICVLPFANMSADPQQEYFSDGITEDVITDLSKVSSLFVVARNTAFTFKGKAVDIPQVARQLGVSHVLEGSVRKAGDKVRITAQLIDGVTGGHIWAERYDRDLTDIFALQDEISEAIVAALKLKLLPAEKRAIEQRATTSLEAYNLYLMARRYYFGGGNRGKPRAEAMVRLCRRAIEIDPGYAQAWALLATAQQTLHFVDGMCDDGFAAAEKALELDPDLAAAHAVRAQYLSDRARFEDAAAEFRIALQLDPQSFEANLGAGRNSYRAGRHDEACRYFATAADTSDDDIDSVAMLTSACAASGDTEGMREAARRTLERAERALTRDNGDVAATSYGGYALSALGDAERAKSWIDQALLIEPDNQNMRYNMACAVAVFLKDTDFALSLLEPIFAAATGNILHHAEVDPDLAEVRKDPRFTEMIEAARKRQPDA